MWSEGWEECLTHHVFHCIPFRGFLRFAADGSGSHMWPDFSNRHQSRFWVFWVMHTTRKYIFSSKTWYKFYQNRSTLCRDTNVWRRSPHDRLFWENRDQRLWPYFHPSRQGCHIKPIATHIICHRICMTFRRVIVHMLVQHILKFWVCNFSMKKVMQQYKTHKIDKRVLP